MSPGAVIFVLAILPWITPFTTVAKGEKRLAAPAWEHSEINRLLKGIGTLESRVGACPACGGELCEIAYEGVPLRKCASCKGRLVTRERFARILAREEQPPLPQAQALVRKLVGDRLGRRESQPSAPAPAPPRYRCPSCAREMTRMDYEGLLPHRVQIDRCDPCGKIWFDADELETIEHFMSFGAG